MQKKPVFYTRFITRGGLTAALLLAAGLLFCAPALLSSCANAVNSRGGPVDGSGSSGGGASGGGSASGSNSTTRNGRGGAGAGGTAPGEITGANSSRYTVGERIDYAAQTGTSVSSSTGAGYITVTPPQNPLPYKEPYTADGSGTQPSWTEYRVTVTVGGTPFSFTFAAGSTEAKVIDNVPTGTTLSAESEMDLSDGAWGTNGAGTPLCAVAAPAVIQSGDNTITMYARYPLVCQMSSDAAGQGAAITGTAPAYYTNGSPTPLPAATESYVDGSGTTLRFAGWALTDGGTPVISGSVPSTGVYKGKLTLWACYSECTVSISTGAAGTDPILAEGDTLALTAVPAGFPSAPAYTWSIESPAAAAPVTVSASGVVSPVPGKSGSATVKVTATCGALTATATQNVSVAAISVTGAAAVEAMRLADGSKSVSATVSGYTGTVEYSWTSSSTAVAAVSPADSASVTVAPASGGITTLSVTAALKDGSGSTIKVLPVKTIDAAVLEVVLGGSGLPADTTDPIVLTAGSTETAALTATLRGISSGVTYAWESGAPSLFTVSPANTSGTTVTPVAAGSDSVTATLTYKGVSVSASRNVSVAGIRLVLDTGSAVRVWDPVGSNALSLTVQPVGFAAVDSYTTGAYASDDTTVATVTATGGGSGMDVQFLKGGAVTVTAVASYGGKTLTATKELAMLQLQLGGSGLPSGSNPIVLTAGSTETAALTATLVGLTADSWLWQSSDTAKFTVSTPAATAATTVTPVAAGSGTVTVKATYDGVDITASRNVSVAGLSITGTSPYLWNATAASQTFDLSVESVGLPAGASVTYNISQYSSSDTDVATIATGGSPEGATITVTANKGGVTTITAKATYGSKTLTATKDIAILKLNVTRGGMAVPTTGNRVSPGAIKLLTAELEGIPAADVSYSWTTSDSTKVSRSPSIGATTTLTGVAEGTANISVTATYKSTETCSSTMAFRCALPSVTMKTGSQIHIILWNNLGAKNGGAARSFAASAIPPAEGTATYKLSTDDSEGECLAWLDGTAIKYYAEDYTDATPAVKIPLNADSSSMFSEMEVLTSLDVSGFDTSGVTDMSGMFYGCKNLPTITGLENFDTSSVTNMAAMFRGCEKLTSLDLSSFNTSSVTNMSGMFATCYALTGITGVENFDTSNVTGLGMNKMFWLCNRITSLNLSSFNTSKVTSMEDMFDCGMLTSLDLSSFDTSSVTNMTSMFYGCNNLSTITGLENFDTSKVTDMKNMFRGCTKLASLDLSSFDTSNVTRMEQMFLACETLTSLDLSSFNTSSVSNMGQMFSNCINLNTISVSNLFVTTSVSSGYSDDMFKDCTSLVGGAGTAYDAANPKDKTYAHIDGGSSNPGYFTAAP